VHVSSHKCFVVPNGGNRIKFIRGRRKRAGGCGYGGNGIKEGGMAMGAVALWWIHGGGSNGKSTFMGNVG